MQKVDEGSKKNGEESPDNKIGTECPIFPVYQIKLIRDAVKD